MMQYKRIALVTGGFDPLHSGHIEYFSEAKKHGDRLIVGVNSDQWLVRKKGNFFLPFRERACIVSNLKVVDDVIRFNDDDGTAIAAIEKVIEMYPEAEIVFANGGDRTATNIPEMEKFYTSKVTFVFGVGGDTKRNSSRWILSRWKNDVSDSIGTT